MEPEIIHIPELALMLGRSESAIRSARQAGAAWLPPSFMQGSRICWRVSTVRQFLQEYERACMPLGARAGNAKRRRHSPAGNSSLLRAAGRSGQRVTRREIDVSRSAHIAGLSVQLSRMAGPVGFGVVLCPLPRIGVVAIGSHTDFLGTAPECVESNTVCRFLHSVLNSTRSICSCGDQIDGGAISLHPYPCAESLKAKHFELS